MLSQMVNPRYVPVRRAWRCNALIPFFSDPGPLFSIPLPYSLPLCYNRPAVERAAKWELVQAHADPAEAAAQSAATLQNGRSPVASSEDPSRYCPVCSQRLESRRCKLICSACGYYMSCSDYY